MWHISSTIRAPIFSLLTNTFFGGTYVRVANGGQSYETFLLDRNFDHTQAVSSLVSSNSAFGATTGEIILMNEAEEGIQFSWDQSVCALIPMIQHVKLDRGDFTRLIFTTQEFDDTFKEGQGKSLLISVKLRPLS